MDLRVETTHQSKNNTEIDLNWGGRIRTSEWRDQNPLPYRLATPHRLTIYNDI